MKAFSKLTAFWRKTNNQLNIHTERIDFAKEHCCKLLKSRKEVLSSIQYLREHGYQLHDCEPKNWDLAHILPHIQEGNFLDMGSWESHILKNLATNKPKAQLYGIDLQAPKSPVPGVKHLVGDLMETKLPNEHFQNISCLSVIEHGVNFTRLAQETSRLLTSGGKLFITYDYWDPKIFAPIHLYGLEWQPLDRLLVLRLIEEFEQCNLRLVGEMDWELGESVIREGYHSPVPSMRYTFGINVFQKK